MKNTKYNVFNFIPKTAVDFYNAVANDDTATQHRLLHDFFMPYLSIRNRMGGYAVSIVTAIQNKAIDS